MCPETLPEAGVGVATMTRLYSCCRTTVNASRTWMCLICGWIYDEATGLPDEGIAPGTPWDQVPMNWVCPECGARKEDFEMVQV